MPTKVQLYIYDMSMGMAAQLSPLFLGKQIDGIWHTGVVVFGREYYFGGMGIEWCYPGGTILGQPLKVQDMGDTHITLDVFEEFLRGKQPRFRPECYNLLNHNCNNFSNEIVQFLTGSPIPDYIVNLPSEALNSPFGQQLLPFLQMLSGPSGGSATSFDSVPKVEQPKPSTAAPETGPELAFLPLDFELSVVVTELKGIANKVGIDQKLLDDLSAISSLQENPSTAMSLAKFLWETFSCTMEPPNAAEIVAKYFLAFTSSSNLLLELSKQQDNATQLVSKLTLCSIEASMCDHKETVLKLVGTALVNCLHHKSLHDAIKDQCDDIVQATVNSFLLRNEPSLTGTNSALVLNVAHINELTEDHLQELVPALLQFLQSETASFTDQQALWSISALLKLLKQSPEMLEVAKVMSLDLTKLKSRQSEPLKKLCADYDKLINAT
ncbi:uncharacterized protein [Dysidea avara]|uniref:uncharacterized protein n=1 Tax=Dysidea avara TaxID=196820 RepID=UPI003331F28F